MVVNAPEELVAEQVQHENRTSPRTSSRFVVSPSNEQLSLKGLMEKVGLKHRPTFWENYTKLAFKAVFNVLCPASPISETNTY